jgi:hypothetical protein
MNMPETKDPPASNPAAGFADAIDRLRAAGASAEQRKPQQPARPATTPTETDK